ncbi:MAG TPA: hypothetical protein VGA40_04840, partial [Candidatus Acidoferrales bacterium]
MRPEQSFLRARAEVTLRAPEDAAAPITAIEFELNPRLEIDAITGQQNRRLEWQRSGRIGSASLLVQLAEPLAAGQQVTLTFSYRGSPLLYGPLDYFSNEGVLLRDESRWYPVVDISAFATHEITTRLPSGWQS